MGAIEAITTLPTLPPRAPDSHKGDFGRVLIVAGSRGMSGAAILCGSAALKAGAGLVEVAVPAEILPIVAAGNPCYTTAALPGDVPLTVLAAEHDVIAIGPGLGRGDAISATVADLVVNVEKPMVIDADGLNALIGRVETLAAGKGLRIITPHPGEFARLLQIDTKTVQANRRELAVDFALKHKCIVVLKGRGTIVTDGERVYENRTGNAGLAKGATGDVLTGVIAALLGQRLPAFEAAQLGVHVHGLAGDLARDQIGEVSMLATDVLDFLAPAIRQIQR